MNRTLTYRPGSESRTAEAGPLAQSGSAPALLEAHTRRWWQEPLAWTALLTGGASVALALAVVQYSSFPLDSWILRTVQATDLGWLVPPMTALNVIGFPPVVGFVYGGVIAGIFLARQRWQAAGCAFAVLGGWGLNNLVKALVPRDRPPADVFHVERHISNSSFPAGHVLNFLLFTGFLCYLACGRVKSPAVRAALIAIVAAAVLLMGVARLLSGEHWPSDVLAGYLIASAWLSVTILLYRRVRGRYGRPRASALLLLLAGAASLGFQARRAGATPSDSLEASWETPWNPEHAMPAREPWERALLLPGRVASLPLSGLGMATERALTYLENGNRLPIGPSSSGSGSRVLSIRPTGLGDRTGFGGIVAAGTALPLHSRLEVEYGASNKLYNRTLVTWSGKPLSLQYGYEWRPQDRFYGVGASTSVDSVSDFALQQEFARAATGWTWGQDPSSGRPRAGVSAWIGPRSAVTSHGRENPQVSYDQRFPFLATTTLDQRVEHLVAGASALLDHRTGSPRWSQGWRLQASAERFGDPVRGLALHSAAAEGAEFARYQLEGETGFSFDRDPRTIRLMVHVTDQQVTARRDRFLPYDMATLGGRPGLGGFVPGRFHDLDMAVGRISYIFPLVRRLELDLHSEWGSVYSDVWNQASLRTLRNSFGFAVRGRGNRSVRGALGLDVSPENFRVRYSLGPVE